jgi:uncharacterized membrane protein
MMAPPAAIPIIARMAHDGQDAANLTVWTFRVAEDARRALDVLRALQRTGAITVHEAALIEWPPDRSEPETREFHHLDTDADRSRIWRGLFRAVFGVEEAIGAFFQDLGVDDRLIAHVRPSMKPGTSVLFVLTSGGFYRELEPSFRDFDMTLLYTTLPESRLRGVGLKVETTVR